MKYITVLLVLSLSACSIILPIDHDPVMFGEAVDVKIELNAASCDNKDWKVLNGHIVRLETYANLRGDPQAESIKKMGEAVANAQKSTNEKFCDSVLKIQRTRIDVIIDAWRGR